MIPVKYKGNMRGFSYPRSIVLFNGNPMYHSRWTCDLNNTSSAGNFSVDLPFKTGVNLNPGYLVNSPEHTSYLFTNPNVKVEVYVGFPKNPNHFTVDDLTQIMVGYMDQAELNFGLQSSTGWEVVTVTGRDMTAPFLDSQTTLKYQNMTSSSIAIMMAKKHGLKYSVKTTYTLVGKYYNADHSRMSTQLSEWDLLNYLADHEGFASVVIDETLYFRPFDEIVSVIASHPLNYTWGQNILDLRLTKSPHASKDIIIDVHSYDSTKKRHVTATAKKTYSGSGGQSYHEVYYYANKTLAQCQAIAKSKLTVLSQLEVTGTMTVSGDPELVVNRQIELFGTGVGLDQSYYIREATHSFDTTSTGENSGGYQCDLTFSNLLVENQQTSSGV
jgi:hypothetical protein